jgi:hypothetical protein
VKKLFGEENTSEQQGVKPLINRFNRPVLTKKLIYAEEVKVSTGSEDGNKLKTLISERSTMSEAKGKDIAPIDHRCCFLLTSNHKPIWLEPGDRRFYIIKVDHEGYSAGGRDYDRFVALIRRVKAAYEDPEQVASLYHALRQRTLDAKFNPYSLNVQEYATEVMKEINTLSGDVVEELLREFVTEKQLFSFLFDTPTRLWVISRTVTRIRVSMSSIVWGGRKASLPGVANQQPGRTTTLMCAQSVACSISRGGVFPLRTTSIMPLPWRYRKSGSGLLSSI